MRELMKAVKIFTNMMGPGTGFFSVGILGLSLSALLLSACQRARLEPKGPADPTIVVQQADPQPDNDQVINPRRQPTPIPDRDDDIDDTPDDDYVPGDITIRDDRDPTIPDAGPLVVTQPDGRNTVGFEGENSDCAFDDCECNNTCQPAPVEGPYCPPTVPVRRVTETNYIPNLECQKDVFEHPSEAVTLDLDVLIVLDSSSSITAEMTAIAEGFENYLENIDENMNVRIGVLLGHGFYDDTGRVMADGRDLSVEPNLYGQFYIPSGSSGNTIAFEPGMNRQEIIRQLSDRLLGPVGPDGQRTGVPSDQLADGGEAGLASLMGLLSQRDRYRQSGEFFREGAALHIMFVSDEADICTPGNQRQGVELFALNDYWYNNGTAGQELSQRGRSYNENYSYEDFAHEFTCGGMTYQNVIDVIDDMRRAEGKVVLATAIVYKDMNSAGLHAENDADRENERGTGYIEFVQEGFETNLGMVIDINEAWAAGAFTEDLVRMGRQVHHSVNFVTNFQLTPDRVVEGATFEPRSAYSYTPYVQGHGGEHCQSIDTADENCPNMRQIMFTRNQFDGTYLRLTPGVQIGLPDEVGVVINSCSTWRVRGEDSVYYVCPSTERRVNTPEECIQEEIDAARGREGGHVPAPQPGPVEETSPCPPTAQYVYRPLIGENVCHENGLDYQMPGGRFVIGGPE